MISAHCCGLAWLTTQRTSPRCCSTVPSYARATSCSADLAQLGVGNFRLRAAVISPGCNMGAALSAARCTAMCSSSEASSARLSVSALLHCCFGKCANCEHSTDALSLLSMSLCLVYYCATTHNQQLLTWPLIHGVIVQTHRHQQEGYWAHQLALLLLVLLLPLLALLVEMYVLA
jgi:hypothetical protein